MQYGKYLAVVVIFGVLPRFAHAATVVEYYNSDLDHYFVTSDPNEQSMVDSGAVGQWQRTGTTFPTGGPDQVCRFYGSSLGPNSHFYTADSSECANLKSIYNPAAKSWKFESNDFAITKASNGSCSSGLTPIYRAYNNGFARGVDSNHRITPNQADIQQVVARGWSNEGIVMCAGASTSSEPFNKTQSAKLVGGQWILTYTILSAFTQTYTFTSVASSPNSDGDYFVIGYDAYGDLVGGSYNSKLGKWGILDESVILDRFFTFTFTDSNHVSGCYYQISPPGSTNISKCYPMIGSRSNASPNAENRPVNPFASLPSKPELDALRYEEVAHDSLPGFIEQGARESYLSHRRKLDETLR